MNDLDTQIRNASFWQKQQIDYASNLFDVTDAELKLHFACHAQLPALLESLKEATGNDFNASIEIQSHKIASQVEPRSGIKNIIAVASGKGGVGKSTIAVNLAIALQQEGAKVGLLDADIYGPSQPIMLGGTDQPESKDGKTLEPLMRHGIQAMSIGYLLEQEDTAMIWRGPMVSTALQQLFRDTQWHDLDYLIIDLPPGTGDIQLTLVQKLPLTAAVVVTTPQDIALADARKAYRMFEKVNVPVLGVVENMSWHICSHCGHKDYIFGEKGAAIMAEQFHLPLLGKLPLNIKIRDLSDKGEPIVAAIPDCEESNIFHQIAIRMSAQLAKLPVQKPSRFPKVVTE